MLDWNRVWYQKRVVLWYLIPFSFLYQGFIKLRRKCYRYFPFLKKKGSVPVIIVGNITVGGTGKTPLVIHIAEYLIEQGWQPGIITRGYKGRHRKPTAVNAKSDPKLVGDEAILLSKKLTCPIVVGKNRPSALKFLLKTNPNVDIIISDDGLQHYALDRQIEIAVIDRERRFGNGYCLPAGPLRESESRLADVDLVVLNTGVFYDISQKIPQNKKTDDQPINNINSFSMGYTPDQLYNAFQKDSQQPLAALRGQKVHAIAGIGNPERFFKLLASYGLIVIKHPFPDHHVFTHRDLHFRDEYPVIMTEKDVVKCAQFMDLRHWVLPIKAAVDPAFDSTLLTLVKGHCYG